MRYDCRGEMRSEQMYLTQLSRIMMSSFYYYTIVFGVLDARLCILRKCGTFVSCLLLVSLCPVEAVVACAVALDSHY
jgi:hypothetical protein